MMQNQNQWYVQVSGQSYGPYSMAQMIAFIGEGRIIAGSLISQDATQGFAMAAGFPAFAGQLAPYASPQVLQQAHAQQQHAVSQASAALTPQPQPAAQTPAQVAMTPSVFLVMAEINSENGMRFLQALQSFGPAQRIGDTVWLVRGAADIDNLRNALANTLTRQDRVFIMDSFNNRTAWFNIGADMDSRIKELWASIPS